MPRFRPVFTPFGCVVLLVSLCGLIRSLIVRNSYEIALFSAALFLLLVFGVIAFWKTQKLKLMEPGWKPPFPFTANAADETQHLTLITGIEGSVPPFFRLHFIIKGRFFACGDKNGIPMKAETSIPRGETEAQLRICFPVSGILQGDGYCLLCDIFGFFSFSCGKSQKKTVKVRSAPCFGDKLYINALTGAEDQRNKPAADIERYYMREYTPGDRFRDINWKSSEKIDALITRISTDNQEKVSRIEIFFRNFGPANALNMEGLWLLDRAKARLSYFLRSLMELNSSFIFDVRAAGGSAAGGSAASCSWEIQNMEELDVFLEELAGLSFSPLQHETAAPANTGELYVFSTACDTMLPGFILSCNARPVTLFLVQPAEKKTINNEQKKEIEVLARNDFIKDGCYPSLRLFRKNVKWLNAHANRVEIFHAEIKS